MKTENPADQGRTPPNHKGGIPIHLQLLPILAAVLLTTVLWFIASQQTVYDTPSSSPSVTEQAPKQMEPGVARAADTDTPVRHDLTQSPEVRPAIAVDTSIAPKKFHLRLGWVGVNGFDGNIHLGLIDGDALKISDSTISAASRTAVSTASTFLTTQLSPVSGGGGSVPLAPSSPDATDATIAGTGWKGTVNNGNANAGDWSNAGNWDSTGPAADERNLFFGAAYNTAGGTNFIANNDIAAFTGYRITFESVASPVAFTLQGNAITLADFGGSQAKIENLSTAAQTLNLGITFGASTATFAEINAVNGTLTFGGSLGASGTITDLRLFGSSQIVNFNGTVSWSGRDAGIATAGTGNTVNINGSFTADNFSIMNGGTLNLNSGGSLNTTGVRLGADYVGSGNLNNALGATFQLTNAAGGQTFAGTLNSGTGNTSNALVVNSQNTSGCTNALSGNLFLDSSLAIVQSSGGTLTISGTTLDLKANTLSLRGAGGNINITGVLSNSTAGGQLVIGTNGTASTGGTVTLSAANTYSGQTFIRNGTLAFTSTGSSNSSTLRLGSSSGSGVDASINFTTAAGGVSISSTINPVTTSGSGALTLNSQNTSGTNTYSGHIGLDRDFTITQTAGTGTLTISQAHTDGVTAATGYDIKGFNATFTPGAGGTINVTGDIYSSTGTGNLIMNGAGTLILNGTLNAYTGTTTISNGTLSANKIVVSSSNSSLGNAASAVILGGAATTGTLSYTGAAATYVRGFTVNAGGGGLTNAGTGLLQLSTVGTTIASGGILTFATNANGIQVNGTSVVSGAGAVTLNSTGAGTLALLGQNTHSGGTTLQQGTMTIGANSTITTGALASGPVGIGTFHIGSGTNSAIVNTTAATTRTLNNNISFDGDATFATTAGSGTFVFDTIGTLTTPNSITLTRTNQLTINSTVTLQLGGLVSGSGFGITKLGAGTLNLGGGSSAPADNTSNTYSGLTTISAGTLNLNKGTNGVTAIAGDILINGGTLAYGTSRDEQIANSAKLTITSGNYSIATGRTETIGQTITATSGLALSGTGAISIAGSGVLNVVNGAMTGGSIALAGTTNVLQTNSDFNFTGGTIDFSGVATTGSVNLRGGDGTGMTYSASGTSTAQITNTGGGTSRVSLNTTLGATTVFNIADAPTVATEMSIGVNITGAVTQGFRKTGAGLLLLTANNGFLGATTIDGGTLNAGAAGALGGTSGITINGGGTLLLSNSGTNNHINNAATMTLNGGTFNTGGVSENGSVGIGALTLQTSSIIDMASGASIINFANSSAATWSGIISIYNWSGDKDLGGGTDQLIFGSDATGLSSGQLAEFQFYSGAGVGAFGPGAIILSTGEVVPIPEPGTWVAGGLALIALVLTQRRRFRSAGSPSRRKAQRRIE